MSRPHPISSPSFAPRFERQLWGVTDWWIQPDPALPSLSLMRLRLVTVVVVLMAIWAGGFVAQYLLLGVPWIVPAVIASAVVGLGFLLWGIRRGMQPERAATILVLLLFVGHVPVVTYIGGVTMGGIAWLIILPFAGLALGTWRTALVALGLLAVFAVGLNVLEMSGNLPDPILPPELNLNAATVSVIFVSAMLLLFGALFEFGRHRTMFDLVQANALLEDEVQEHRATRDKLQRTHDELVANARKAGMAEVAIGALHNIGNALNGVNVSTSQASLHLGKVRLERLDDVAGMLEEEGTDARLPLFMRRLSKVLCSRRDAALAEIDAAKKGIEHVAQVVAAQQSHARHGGFTELVTLEEMIDAVTVLIVLPDSVRAVVTVEVEGPILVERHKLLQILANLILNARDAVVSSGVAEPCIRIDAQCAGGQVEVVVTDNGVGIPASELPQIFGHGFTTKENGHGFGLHASAIAARELGGTLVAESDGDGRGARFCLTFPVTPQVPLRLIG